MYTNIHIDRYIDRHGTCDNLYAGVPLRMSKKCPFPEESSFMHVNIDRDRHRCIYVST